MRHVSRHVLACSFIPTGETVMKGLYVLAVAVLAIISFGVFAALSEGNSTRGQRVFGACAMCHSLQPDQNMTGPSLANLWNRKAGTVASFTRYSAALKSSNIVWNDKTLDNWLTDPQHLVPGNEMTFAGIKDPRQRADLLAFLKEATRPGVTVAQQGSPMGGMGMMGGNQVPDLKQLGPQGHVKEVTYCKDTYTVTTANGQARKFWERNLRLMTDASGRGPAKNEPVIVGAGMMGDRADLIFADPSEISSFIATKC
jgi:cytochrome c